MDDENSTKPTLLRRGFIVPRGDSDKYKKIAQNSISIDIILHHISDKVPEAGTSYVKDFARSYGYKVILLKSQTGSGKSTTLPPYLYKSFFHRSNRSIICTQPRVLTALDIPEGLPEYYPFLKMGTNLGYSTKSFKLIPTDRGIIYATVGVLQMELLVSSADDFIKKYQFIILDEIHERSLEIDSTLYLLKKFLKENYKNPMCPIVILMSATFDEKIFMNYFEIPDENYIQVKGSTFEIKETFADYSVSNFIKYATLKAQSLHLDNLDDLEGNAARDIIIFVKDSGIGKKIEQGMHLFNSILDNASAFDEYKQKLEIDIDELLKKGGGSLYILPIMLDTKSFSKGELEYQNLFTDLNLINVPIWKLGETDSYKLVTPSRRIIIATNVAETGITIDTLKYCIDTGYQNSSEFFPEFGCQSLIAKNISHGSAMQRRGRVGRKAPGFWFPCYTKETFDALNPEQISSIIVNDVTELLLIILIREKKTSIVREYGVGRIRNNKAEDNIFQMHLGISNAWFTLKNELSIDIFSVDYIELPSVQSLEYSIEKLHVLGFIDDNYDVTAVGYYADKLRFINSESRKMILSGYHYGADIMSLITIVCFIYVGKRNVFEKGFVLDSLFSSKNYKNINDDFISCLIVFNALQEFIESKNISEINICDWCEKNLIKFDGLCKVLEQRDILLEIMIENGLNIYYNGLDIKYNFNKIIDSSLFLDEIKKIKYCIYEGFKLNVLRHDRFSTYTSVYKKIPIKVKSTHIQEYPKFIICDSINLSQKFGSEQYEFLADGYISVLDNYVDPDVNFFNY